MRLLLIIFALFAAITAYDDNSTAKEFLDLNDVEDNVILWKNLFLKLNTIIDRQEKLTQELLDVNKRIDDTNKSQQWTTILRRQDGSVSFNRGWMDYKQGFGNPNADFFIGLDRLHALTTSGPPQELLVVLIDFENQTRFAKYSSFSIGSETEMYAMKELGSYTGDAGDGLGWHRGKKFSTHDRDNNSGNIRDCPQTFQGGWWFHDPCYSGHLHGPYRDKSNAGKFGVSWHPWRGWDYSVKYAAMMIRNKG